MIKCLMVLIGWEGFPGGSNGKESACNVRDLGSIPGSGRCPGAGNSSPLQHSCLENSIDRGTWQATVHGVTKSQTLLSEFHFSLSLDGNLWYTVFIKFLVHSLNYPIEL